MSDKGIDDFIAPPYNTVPTETERRQQELVDALEEHDRIIDEGIPLFEEVADWGPQPVSRQLMKELLIRAALPPDPHIITVSTVPHSERWWADRPERGVAVTDEVHALDDRDCGLSLTWRDDLVLTGDKTKLKIGKNVRIDSWVKIEIGEGVEIGDDTHVASYAHLNVGGGFLSIGERCGIATHAVIVTGGDGIDAPSMTATADASRRRVYKSRVTLGDDVSVLASSIVLPGSEMCDGSRLAAGSVLTGKLVEPGALYMGSPARFRRFVR